MNSTGPRLARGLAKTIWRRVSWTRRHRLSHCSGVVAALAVVLVKAAEGFPSRPGIGEADAGGAQVMEEGVAAREGDSGGVLVGGGVIGGADAVLFAPVGFDQVAIRRGDGVN